MLFYSSPNEKSAEVHDEVLEPVTIINRNQSLLSYMGHCSF